MRLDTGETIATLFACMYIPCGVPGGGGGGGSTYGAVVIAGRFGIRLDAVEAFITEAKNELAVVTGNPDVGMALLTVTMSALLSITVVIAVGSTYPFAVAPAFIPVTSVAPLV